MKILVVDDSKAMRMIISRCLRQAGFSGHEVIEASNGREGFEAVHEHSPDLVLSDWNMPEVSGLELLQQLNRSGKAVKFGFITSEGSTSMRKIAADNGALFLIAKPFDSDAFKDALTPVMA